MMQVYSRAILWPMFSNATSNPSEQCLIKTILTTLRQSGHTPAASVMHQCLFMEDLDIQPETVLCIMYSARECASVLQPDD
jgi:hypothetical protein